MPLSCVKYLLCCLFGLLPLVSSAAPAEKTEVIAKGFPGKPMKSINKTFLNKILQEKYDLVVVLFGTNDACNSRALASEEAFKKSLVLTVDLIRTQKCKVILTTVPPCNEECLFKRHKKEKFGNVSPNVRIKNFNRILSEVAKEKKVPLADFYSVAAKYGTSGKNSLLQIPANNGGDDGIHLTAAGYEMLARCIASTIRQAGYTPRKVLCLGDSLTYGIGVKSAEQTYPVKLEQILNQP